MKPELFFTGERFIPGQTDYGMTTTHEHRYQLTVPMAEKRKILDFGCGAGYGAQLLARVAQAVVAFDPDEETIAHLRELSRNKNLSFTSQLGDLVEHAGTFDLVVCFEVLEHVVDPDPILSPIRASLRDDGLLILSTPNKAKYQDLRENNNPFHLHEYYLDELQALLEQYFVNVQIFGQDFVATSVIFPLAGSSVSANISRGGGDPAPVSDGFIAVCSNSHSVSSLSGFYLPNSLSESDNIVDGLSRTDVDRLLSAMDEEREQAQKVLNGWEGDISRLNEQIHLQQKVLELLSNKGSAPRITEGKSQSKGVGLLKTVLRRFMKFQTLVVRRKDA